MSYLTSSTSIKKKFCSHDYQIKYPHRTNKSYLICIKCNDKRLVAVSDEGLIFDIPVSKQSNSENIFHRIIEWQCETDWDNTSYNGWKLPGTQSAHDWCGEWKTKGCLNLEKHKGTEYEGKIFVKRYQRFCYRGDCERCHKKWMLRESNKATRRILEFQKEHRQLVRHIIVSPSKADRKLSDKKLRKKTYSVLKSCGVIGGVVFHPFKPRNKKWPYEPHFHALVFGYRTYRPDLRKKDGLYVKDAGLRNSVFGTFLYILSHAGVKPRNHTTTWFGDLSYSKLRLEIEHKSDQCPCCESELEPLKYMYVTGKPPPPDEIIEMFVDPRGWEPVRTRNLKELSKIELYDYVIIQELYDSNKGISL